MPPTLKDFQSRREAQLAAERERASVQTMQIRQAKVKAELLMQHEGWDYFLSHWQSKLEEARQNEFEWLQRMGNAMLEQDIRMTQINYHIWKERAALLDELIAFPSQMRGQAAHNGPAGNPAHNVEET
jgi:hypothetical protein